ncbi:MAG: tripartite tricarboxylate transporter substrate binding protein [Betaproteobacteria bacterium]|nr:tripartite tricarboxylate transporter substrate binding protein [Betaproteobacteria bacterium]
MNARRKLIILGVVLTSLVNPSALLAQTNYPTKAIRVIVPFPAGRGPDITTRQIAARMSPLLGQPVVIENRPGASGIVGTEIAAKAAPDGYTLYAGPITTIAMIPYLYSTLPYDVERDFVPISQLNGTLIGMAISPGLPVTSVKELIDLSKKRTLNIGTSGVGSSLHLFATWFAMLTGAHFHYIHYNTTNPGPDLMAGRIDAAVDAVPSYAGAYRGGKVKLLAVVGKIVPGQERHPSFPEVPTFAESGLAEFAITSWTGLFAPTGVAQPFIDQLAGAVAKASNSPDLIKQFRAQGSEPVGSTPAEFAALIKSEQAKWRKVIRAAEVKLD